MTYTDLRPDRVRNVSIHIDGQWYDGELEAWRFRDGRWEGWVRWRKTPGSQRIGWHPADVIRRDDRA